MKELRGRWEGKTKDVRIGPRHVRFLSLQRLDGCETEVEWCAYMKEGVVGVRVRMCMYVHTCGCGCEYGEQVGFLQGFFGRKITEVSPNVRLSGHCEDSRFEH